MAFTWRYQEKERIIANGGIKMKIVLKKTIDLIEYENNPRNNDEAVNAVANSIKEFGFKVPIVITSDNTIIAGHN